MRLDKLLGLVGFGSRNQVKKLLHSRQVRIDGEIVTAIDQIVDTDLQDIRVAGRPVGGYGSKYFLLHKPAGVVTAVTDKEHQTVVDMLALENRVEGIYPIGRLDRDTEGLVLLTNNGPLGFRLLHPQYHIEKTYYVEVNGPLDDDALTFFLAGVEFLDGTKCKPAQLEILSSGREKSCAHIRIAEGKFHQVKKMFLAYGVKVTYLKRIRFGEFDLGDLPLGHYRNLDEEELQYLKKYFTKK
ncbi:pseudouridine synthase [Streptococcus gallinaceus]|uniref:Pseudouridine synthase n=1 Tax=Streptococcus gallinaceus TaxID=165758 RepID=A0ABV2JI70_9STRE